MKKNIIITLLLIASFYLGYAYNKFQSAQIKTTKMKRVTGIGGVFFKCKDPKTLRAWYQKHLGLNTNQYGAVFEWFQGADSTKKGFLQWSPFKESTNYFLPSTKDYMINYRVHNLNQLIDTLKLEGVTVTDTIQSFDYGKFAHIIDLEGNKIELWEPNDVVYEQMGKQMGSATTK